MKSTLIASIVLGIVAGSVQAALFQPDSATASSEWSGSYVITNTINGSGPPVDFGPTDAHATYVGGNHWTTANGNTVGQYADFFFNDPVTIGTFHMWNHLSNGVASNSYYAVTKFDLFLYDDDNNELFSLLNQSATPYVAVAQSYMFAPVDDVSRVHFLIQETMQQVSGNTSAPLITGLAEVAFEAIPEPASLGLIAVGALACLRGRKPRV